MAEYALRLENSADTKERMRMGDAMHLAATDSLAARGGLRPDGGGQVTVVEGSMDVDVSPLVAWVVGGAAGQGGYPYVLDAIKRLTLSDGDATQDRVDTIAVVVRHDPYDSSGVTEALCEVVEGTPGAGPPVLPPTCEPLQDVDVPAGVSAGTGGLAASNLGVERRRYTSALGGVLPVGSATERDGLALFGGLPVYRIDTGDLEFYDALSTAWRQVAWRQRAYVELSHGGTTRSPGQEAIVSWDYVREATNADVSGSTVTIQVSGLYNISHFVNARASDWPWWVDIEINGTREVRAFGGGRQAAGQGTSSASLQLPLQAGDTIRQSIGNHANSSTTIEITSGRSNHRMTVARVSD